MKAQEKNGTSHVKIADEEVEELYDWLSGIEFSRPKKTLARDFSDGTFMAELLKKYYPRMIDLHNYPPANSLNNKLKNWETLNCKVLTPLGLIQNDKFLKDVSSGNKGTIEQLLYLTKSKIDDLKKKDKEEMEQGIQYTYSDKGNIFTVWVRKVFLLIGGNLYSIIPISVITSEGVPLKSTVTLAEFKNLKLMLNSKEEEIGVLNAKVKHLETLIKFKDQRIEDLVAQINRCTCLRNFSGISLEN